MLIKSLAYDDAPLLVTPEIIHRQLSRGARAQELLDTDKSLKEIAFAVGFGDYRYFARSFKERFGVAPTQLRSDVQLATIKGSIVA